MEHDTKDPGTLRISGRFVGCNPLEISVFGFIRETPDGAEKSNSLSSFSRSRDNHGQMETGFSFEMRNAPVTAERLYYRIYGRQKNFKPPSPYALADFSFPNPLRLPVQPWQAEPLPAKRQIGSLKVALTRANFAPPQVAIGGGVGRLGIDVVENGVDLDQWQPMRIQCSSGLGDSYDYMRLARRDDCTIPGVLWKCLAPWKIKVTLMRIDGFSPGEIIEIKDIPVPAEGQAVTFDQKWDVAGREVKFVRIARGEPPVLEWRHYMGKSSVTMRFVMPDADCSLRLLSVTDAQGKVVLEPRLGEAFVLRGPSDSRNVGFVFLKEVSLPEKISCKFGVVWEKREAEFIVNPTYEGKPFRPKVEIQ